MSTKYQQILRAHDFRNFWLGFTFSAIGDVMSRVALTWFVYELTDSARALGLLAFTYTGPVIIGGLIAGRLLDKFDRRKMMIFDNLIRGVAMLFIPLLYALNLLELWHIYLVSTVYGSFMMISLAGSPSLVPALVEKEHLVTANALETLSFTLAGVIAPFIAGILIPLVGAPTVLLFDVASYFFFALMLSQLHPDLPEHAHTAGQNFHLRDAMRLLLNNKILLSTTLMFMSFNIGLGMLMVALPIFADKTLGGGSQLYGFLLGALAVGEVTGAFLAGAIEFRLSPGQLICIAQMSAGAALAIILLSMTVPAAVISLLLMGAFSAPLTIWAQTLRMQIIPEHLRGRTFALLRTLMQSTTPLGGVLAGVILPVISMAALIALSAILMGVPGASGYPALTQQATVEPG